MPVIYRLDDRDCLVEFNPKWDAFAEENEAPHLAGNRLLGQPLWRHVAGMEVAQLYREVFRKVREQRIQLVFPFRCDSPELRRDMLMKVLPRASGHLEIQCLTRSVLRHSFMETEPLAPEEQLRRELIVMCSWCKSVLLDEQWIPLETAIRKLDLFGGANVRQLTHGICTKCRDDLAH